jgi:ubiquinone/menaquinone biosynthesis C-methylase UbiE
MEPSISDIQNFWNARPCNVRHSKLALGTKPYFEEVAQRRYFVEPHIIDFADFPNWDGKKVLEIGCGIGVDGLNFALNGATYVGIDLSAESLRLAKLQFDLFGVSGEFIACDTEFLDRILPNESFDCIYSFGVLHHTISIQKALRAIRKLMHEKSEFRMMVYAKNSWKGAMIAAGLDQPEAQIGCPIANSYSKEEITQILQESGFNVKSISQDHIFPYKLSEYLKYNYVLEPWFQAMEPTVFDALKRQLGWHLLVTAEVI